MKSIEDINYVVKLEMNKSNGQLMGIKIKFKSGQKITEGDFEQQVGLPPVKIDN